MILNAVMCVWNEEDIIESTVKHAYAQGYSNVFIIDNSSTDNTVTNAINAGAKLACSFKSQYFNEFEKIAHLNTVVRNYNKSSDEKYIWWLYIDADEFPNIDCDLLIIDFLKRLDQSVRGVHGYMFDHVPTHPPYQVQGYHPVDFQPLCIKSTTSKIPLLRYDKNTPHLYSAGGAHTFDTCGESVPVVKDILDIHHFNYRRPENSIGRLKKLVAKNTDGTSRLDFFDKREQVKTKSAISKSMYHVRYNYTKSVYNQNKYSILITDELAYSYKNITRWYDVNDLNIEGDTLINQSIRNYFLKNYDIAMFKFNDLIENTRDNKMKLMLFVKFALCLSFTDKTQSLSILQSLFKCADVEIHDYAKKCYKMICEDKLTEHESNGDSFIFNIDSYSACFESKLFV